MDERGVGHGESIVAPPPEVALTFDDGPGEITPALLDVLAEHRVVATFFVRGEAVQRRPDVLRRAVAEGHAIGNHTYSHAPASELTDVQLRAELARAGDAVARVIGTAPRLARPPYGDDPERFERTAAELGLRTVLWTVDSEDWREPTPPAAAIAERVLVALEPGAVVLLHDGFAGGRDHATVRAVAALLPELARRGYRCVPADA